MLSKILVPLDGSDLAESVRPYVIELALRSDAEVLLLIAVSDVALWDANATVVAWEREQELALGYIENQRDAIASAGVNVSTKIVRGDAAISITKAIDEEGVDLVALSTHGRSGITRFLLGSVAGRVIENTSVPVFTVRPPDKHPGGAINKILVPLDGSALAESILPLVEKVAADHEASIVLMQSVPPVTAYTGFEYAAPTTVTHILDDMQKQSRAYLTGVTDKLRGKGLDVEAATSGSLPTEAILTAADDHGVDLIALATHGRSGLGRVVLGSVADSVVRRSHLPCLLIHPDEKVAS
jgi:nucleotide-binding universal stress UspA family protein